MRTPAPTSPRHLAAGAGLALLAAGLAPVTLAASASANPAGTGLVVNEVYGAGGNSGAALNADFVELLNPTGQPVELLGDYLTYRSSSGSAGGTVALRGTVPAGGTFVVRMSATGGTGASFTADQVASPTVSMSAGGGQVFLTDNGRVLSVTGDVAGRAGVVDMVGLDAASTFEKSSGPAATATTSAQRSNGADTDDNSADFSPSAPTPTAGGGGYTPTDQGARAIADVQGAGDTSPFLYDTVTVRGVVTAAYPTGGLNGVFVQTEGTGGNDTGPGSDAVFVFGSNAVSANPVVGDFVQVVGSVSEFGGLTQVTPGTGGLTKIDGEPHTAPVGQGALPTTEADREAHEGELFAPTGGFTVTSTYTLNNFGEIGLATGSTPLISPTEVARPGTEKSRQVEADNAARAITLDDGSSANYTGSASGTPSPWITPTRSVRVGAAARLVAPVVLDFRNSIWKVQPQQQVTGTGESVATFEDTRPVNSAPQAVGGDLQLATFNVLNYFPTTGEEFDAQPGTTCTFYNDRSGAPITVNSCTPDGPRGAATAASFARQQTKTVRAIIGLGAEIVSLEELENSAKFGKDRDFAISNLVDALNASTAPGTWAFVPSPPSADRPTVAQEDVIRTGYVYKSAAVQPIGTSEILIDEENFDNAREPLAQVFKPAGAPDTQAFTVIVNHFKSKGSGVDDGTGQGNANPDRVGQAKALVSFADSFAAERGTDAVFLAGDFNAYSQEDPLQVLYGEGYEAVESDTPGEETYSFGGLVGSLDHVLANDAALARVTGADVWNINSPESLAYQYGRFNNNVTPFFDASNPFGASDHDPEVVGISDEPYAGQDAVALTASVAPASVPAQTGQAVVSVTATSDGAVPTGLVTAVVDGTVVGAAELTGGKADVRVGPFATAGIKAITLRYAGDTRGRPAETTVSLTVTPAPPVAKAAATVTTAVTPASVGVRGGRATLSVSVAKASGTPTGAVLALVEGEVVGAGELAAGKAAIALVPFDSVGRKAIEVRYLGDDTTAAATADAAVEVVKVRPTVKIKAPRKIRKGSRATILVELGADAFVPHGKVTIAVDGTKVTRRVRNGAASVPVRLTRLGKRKIAITYRGDALTESVTRTVRIRVVHR